MPKYRRLLCLFLIIGAIGSRAPIDEVFAGSAAHHRLVKSKKPVSARYRYTRKAMGADLKWPGNRGFSGVPSHVVLKPGTLIDRYGGNNGRFLSPHGTAFEERALPARYRTDQPYRVFLVTKPLPVLAGRVEPWFGQKGNGTQFLLSAKVRTNIRRGFLKRVS